MGDYQKRKVSLKVLLCNELVSKHKGEVEVIITPASPLGSSTTTRLESTLKQPEMILKVTNNACQRYYLGCCIYLTLFYKG